MAQCASVSEPLFSVVIPAYKVEAYIEQTLRSVYKQTIQDFEIVVVNDGSPDRTLQVLQAQTDPRLRIIDQPNGGECSARNRAVAESRGKFIAFLDSDDAWLPDHLERALAFFEQNPQYNWYATRYTRVPDIKDADLTPASAEKSSYYAINWFLEGDAVTSSSSTVIRRSALPEEPLFPLGVKMFGDGIGWSRFALLHPMLGTTDCSTALYRIWEQSATAAYLRIGRGSNSGAEMDALLIQQQMFLDPASPPEAKLYLRSVALINWWLRIRSASLTPWLPEVATRRPVTGRFLSAWLSLCIYLLHFGVLCMGKLIRLRYNRIKSRMDRLASQARVQL